MVDHIEGETNGFFAYSWHEDDRVEENAIFK